MLKSEAKRILPYTRTVAISSYAGIILIRLSGVISASFVLLSLSKQNKRSTPEIQLVNKNFEKRR